MEQKIAHYNIAKEKFTPEKKEAFRGRLIDFSVSVLKVSDRLRRNPSLHPICDQIIRSSSSIGANINEAQGAGSKKDFAHFFQIALKSAKETQYWLLVLERYDGKIQGLTELKQECDSLVYVLQASLKTLRSKL